MLGNIILMRTDFMVLWRLNCLVHRLWQSIFGLYRSMHKPKLSPLCIDHQVLYIDYRVL